MSTSIVNRKLKPKSDLGRRLLLLCEAKGHRSLRAAAVASGLDYVQLYRIVTAAIDPKWSSVSRIVAALGGDIGEFAPLATENAQTGVDSCCVARLES